MKAPINGYIGNVQAHLGKYLDAGAPICDVIDKSQTMVRLTAYEKDLVGMKVGSRVQFRVNGLGKRLGGPNRSIELYAKVSDTSPLFRPGMYVSARMEKE